MDASGIRNFKDFLQVYNQLTEHCFYKCIEGIDSRLLTPNEQDCADKCAAKFLKYNNRLMMNFVQRQNDLMAKRMKDVEEQSPAVTDIQPS